MNESSKILVAHPWMGKGGSEATAMWTLQALSDNADVTFTTAGDADFRRWNATYGTAIDPGKIDFVQAPRIPGVRSETKWVDLQHSLFERHCRRLGRSFDLCISVYNPIDFGKPGLQLIADLSFGEEMRLRYYPVQKTAHLPSPVRMLYLAGGRLLRGVFRPPLEKRSDLVVANSQWISGKLEEHLGIGGSPILYPPVQLPEETVTANGDRDPTGFVYLGRISPEKKLESMIEILGRVRTAGYPVSLKICGHFTDSEYCERIRDLIRERSEWIEAPGFLDAAEKQRLLASQSFCIHANPAEPFGIAVAEMAAAGCVPLVPATGGAAEIVDSPELQYASISEAAAKITRLLNDDESAAKLRSEMMQAARRYSAQGFVDQLRELVQLFLFLQNLPRNGRHTSGVRPVVHGWKIWSRTSLTVKPTRSNGV